MKKTIKHLSVVLLAAIITIMTPMMGVGAFSVTLDEVTVDSNLTEPTVYLPPEVRFEDSSVASDNLTFEASTTVSQEEKNELDKHSAVPSNVTSKLYFDMDLKEYEGRGTIITEGYVTVFIPYSYISPLTKNDNIVVLHQISKGVNAGEIEELEVAKGEYGILFDVTNFSPFAFYSNTAVTSTSSSKNNDNDNRDYTQEKIDDIWEAVKAEIKKSDEFGKVTAEIGSITDKMPASVMRALYEEKVNLIIEWDGGEDIIIPAGKAVNPSSIKVFYTFDELVSLYANSEILVEMPDETLTTDTSKPNPSTGAKA